MKNNNNTINATINVAAVENNNKEDKDMMNMTKKELVEMAKELGLKGYSKLNKTDLISLIKFHTDEERKVAEAVVAPVVEIVPVVENSIPTLEDAFNAMAEEVVNEAKTKINVELIKAVAKHLVNMSTDQQYAADHNSTGRTWKLFYKVGDIYLTSTKKFRAEVENAIMRFNKTNGGVSYKFVNKVIDELVNRNFMSFVEQKIHFWTFKTPKDMPQGTKDILNGFIINKSMNYRINNDGSIRVDCITDEAIEWLTKYTCPDGVSINATPEQLNKMWAFQQ